MPSVLILSASRKSISPSILSGKPGKISIRRSSVAVACSGAISFSAVSIALSSWLTAFSSASAVVVIREPPSTTSPSPKATPDHPVGFRKIAGPVTLPCTRPSQPIIQAEAELFIKQGNHRRQSFETWRRVKIKII